MLLIVILLQTCGSYAGDLATDSKVTSTLCALNGTQIVVNGIDCLLTGADWVFTCTDLVMYANSIWFHSSNECRLAKHLSVHYLLIAIISSMECNNNSIE